MTDWGVVLATVCGPIFAVLVTRWNDARNHQRSEKMAIFRALMSGRGNVRNIAFVEAINITDVVFHDVPEIVKLKNEFVQYKNVPGSGSWNEDQWALFGRKDTENFNRLLKAIARNVGINSTDIGEQTTVYSPIWLSKYLEGQLNQSEIATVMLKQATAPIKPEIEVEKAPQPSI